jgi:predicted nucleic acid-binding protein
MIVLDTWALLAMLNDEPAAARVEEAWLGEEPVICSVNLGEALYVLIRAHGEAVASQAIDRVRAELEVADPDWSLVTETARIKARGGLSYADCFALATARRHDASLWTGDPEILEVASEDEVVDLRAARR